MKEQQKELSTTMGVSDMVVVVRADGDPNDSTTLEMEFFNNPNTAGETTIRIFCCTKKEILELANNLKKISKWFPNE